MLKLPKKVEYAILASQYIARQKGDLVSVKEISDHLGISFDFLAKSLQKLYKHDLIESYKGVKGGYKLSKSPDKISLGNIIDALDSRPALVDCTSHDHDKCDLEENCSLKLPITIIQSKINMLFDSILLSDLIIDEPDNLQQIEFYNNKLQNSVSNEPRKELIDA